MSFKIYKINYFIGGDEEKKEESENKYKKPKIIKMENSENSYTEKKKVWSNKHEKFKTKKITDSYCNIFAGMPYMDNASICRLIIDEEMFDFSQYEINMVEGIETFSFHSRTFGSYLESKDWAVKIYNYFECASNCEDRKPIWSERLESLVELNCEGDWSKQPCNDEQEDTIYKSNLKRYNTWADKILVKLNDFEDKYKRYVKNVLFKGQFYGKPVDIKTVLDEASQKNYYVINGVSQWEEPDDELRKGYDPKNIIEFYNRLFYLFSNVKKLSKKENKEEKLLKIMKIYDVIEMIANPEKEEEFHKWLKTKGIEKVGEHWRFDGEKSIFDDK